MRSNPRAILILLALVAIFAGFFVYPKLIGEKWRPWRLGLDLVGGSHLVYRVDLSKVSSGERDSVVNGLRDVIERRVNLFGVSEPQVFIARSGEEVNLVVELAGVNDISQAIAQIGDTPFLQFMELQGAGTSSIPVATELTGRHLKRAQMSFDQITGAPEINFELDSEGGVLFENITKNNVGKPICIFVDGEPVIPDSPSDSCPTVQEAISGGNARITGKFTRARAQELVARFNAGALPAEITLINQQTVSATLGRDSLERAIAGGIVGTLLVILFMLFYYRSFGVYASIALLAYILFTLSVFKLIPITMTLAGIAGFILTIGMAVDANILIFERTYEEIRRGLSRAQAIEEGFRRAWPSIRDSNISTMITATILYFFTSSFIKGFALTLLLGVLMSMFSAITITRTLMRVFVKNNIKNQISK